MTACSRFLYLSWPTYNPIRKQRSDSLQIPSCFSRTLSWQRPPSSCQCQSIDSKQNNVMQQSSENTEPEHSEITITRRHRQNWIKTSCLPSQTISPRQVCGSCFSSRAKVNGSWRILVAPDFSWSSCSVRQSWSHFTDIRNSVRLNFTYLSNSSTSAAGTSTFGGTGSSMWVLLH